MIRTSGSQAHMLLFLSLLVVALAVLLLVPAAAQNPTSSTPSLVNPNRAPSAAPVTHYQNVHSDAAPPAPVFSTGSIPSGGTFAILIGVGDLNGDGAPDIVVVNQCVRSFMTCEMDGGSLSVLLNNGTGGFSGPVGTYSTGGNYPYGIAVTDVNHDGKQDVVVGNSCSYGIYPNCLPIAMLLGNGDGSLQSALAYPGSFNGLGGGSGSVTVDVNGDGIPDLITLGATTVNVQLGNPDGTYQPAVTFDPGGYYPNVITVTNVTGSGKPDLLIANTCINQPSCPNGGGSVGVLLNYSQYTATSTVLTSSVNPSRTAEAVTFTATVTGNGGSSVPDGDTVTFENGTTVLGTVPLVGGAASLTMATLPPGTLNITASYAYDGTYGASVGQLSQVVKATRGYATTLALTASPNPAYAQAVTLSAAVSSTSGAIPDGEIITFYNGKTVMGAASTVGGAVSFVIPYEFVPMTYHIQAVYPGDTSFKTSTGSVIVSVYGNQTVTLLNSSLNPSIYGEAISFYIFVTPYSMQYPPLPAPSGTVELMWNGSSIGSVALSAFQSGVSQATLTISKLNADAYPIEAVYKGDSLYAPSISSVTNQVVAQTTSSATLISSLNPSTFGQAVTFTAKISSPTVVAKGLVTFTAGKTVLGTGELSNGTARFTTASLPIGSNSITVTYTGDSDIAGSSVSIVQVVE